MTTLAAGTRTKLRLGFNTRVSFDATNGPAQACGTASSCSARPSSSATSPGWVYQRHFDHYLSSPLPFLAAVGQHTEAISLGTAVLPMRYQDPMLLAEAAGITDLLVGERLAARPVGRRHRGL